MRVRDAPASPNRWADGIAFLRQANGKKARVSAIRTPARDQNSSPLDTHTTLTRDDVLSMT